MNRILKAIALLEYFASHSWEWNINNTKMLMAELGPEDQQVNTDYVWETQGDAESLHTIMEIAWLWEGATLQCLAADPGSCLSFSLGPIRHLIECWYPPPDITDSVFTAYNTLPSILWSRGK